MTSHSFGEPFTETMDSKMSTSRVVGILGTGDYARAIAKRLLQSGYHVIMGSRDPANRKMSSIDEELRAVKVHTIRHVLTNDEIGFVFLAVPADSYHWCLAPSINDIGAKILIDMSCQNKNHEGISNAEKLASDFPDARIVKAFNTLTSYALETESYIDSKQVRIASNSKEARDRVSDLVREMGLKPIDYGSLRCARELEAKPHSVMYSWIRVTLVSMIIFVGWNIVLIFRYLHDYSGSKEKFEWNHFLVQYLNKPLALTGATLIALTYLPGAILAFIQIINGTKYKRYPNWFIQWIKSRRILGCVSICFCAWHIGLVAPSFSPSYFIDWFEEDSKVHFTGNNTSRYLHDFASKFSFSGEVALAVATLAFILLVIMNFSNYTSFQFLLSWRNWRMAQTHLGGLILSLITTHIISFSIKRWMKTPTTFFLHETVWVCVIPILTLSMRLLLLTPCVNSHLKKIQGGWIRGRSYSDDYELKSIG